MKERIYKGMTIKKRALPQTYRGRPRIFNLFCVYDSTGTEIFALSSYSLKETKANIDLYLEVK